MSFERDLKKFVGDKVKKLERKLKRQNYDSVGDVIISDMKNLIRKGISPIRGGGRFPRYKRENDADGYPNTVRKRFPGKRKRPVNLKLSGAFLKALKSKTISTGRKLEIEIGYFDPKEAIKEDGHREGANTQPKRPTIPIKTEEFALSIQQSADDEVVRVVKRAL